MKRLLRTYAVVAPAMSASFAAFWIMATDNHKDLFERYVVAVCSVLGAAMGLFIGIAFIFARKTRLNFVFFHLFVAIAGLFVLVILPGSVGVIYNGAPLELNRIHNPYALYTIPAWLRVVLYVIFTMAMAGVIVEFYNTNWDGPIWKPIRRRAARLHDGDADELPEEE